MTPLEFARAQKTLRCGCYALPFAWMREHGVKTVTTDREARAAWMRLGSVVGSRFIAARIGLFERETQIGDILLFEQLAGDALLGLAMGDGWAVVRSFGVVAVVRPRPLASWGFPA